MTIFYNNYAENLIECFGEQQRKYGSLSLEIWGSCSRNKHQATILYPPDASYLSAEQYSVVRSSERELPPRATVSSGYPQIRPPLGLLF